jgi:phosphoribosylformylglycinamidine (FGAM) synthase PurS component
MGNQMKTKTTERLYETATADELILKLTSEVSRVHLGFKAHMRFDDASIRTIKKVLEEMCYRNLNNV